MYTFMPQSVKDFVHKKLKNMHAQIDLAVYSCANVAQWITSFRKKKPDLYCNSRHICTHLLFIFTKEFVSRLFKSILVLFEIHWVRQGVNVMPLSVAQRKQ